MARPISVRETKANLQTKGFVLDERDHHRYTHFDL